MLVLAAALVTVGVGGVRAATLPTLYVNYSMNCTFTLTDDVGSSVTAIPPGTYQVLVTTPAPFAGPDLSGLTDFTACRGSAEFQLTGPGVSLETTLDDGDSAYALMSATFQKSSTYVALDGNQPSVARVSFTTLASGSPSTPSVSSGSSSSKPTSSANAVAAAKGKAKSPLRGTLAGVVSTAGKVQLRYKGKNVTKLRAGRYKVAVVDHSRTSGFIIQRAHKARLTVAGIPFVGKTTVTLDLTAGQWFFYATFVDKKTYFIVTS